MTRLPVEPTLMYLIALLILLALVPLIRSWTRRDRDQQKTNNQITALFMDEVRATRHEREERCAQHNEREAAMTQAIGELGNRMQAGFEIVRIGLEAVCKRLNGEK